MRDRRNVDPAFRKTLRDRSREMRKEMTPAECKLWSHLRADQFHGLRFRRQHPIGIYVADFFCPRLNLVIELDGDSHFDPEAQRLDEQRTAYFEGIRLREIRFTNDDVVRNIDSVLGEIERHVGVE